MIIPKADRLPDPKRTVLYELAETPDGRVHINNGAVWERVPDAMVYLYCRLHRDYERCIFKGVTFTRDSSLPR